MKMRLSACGAVLVGLLLFGAVDAGALEVLSPKSVTLGDTLTVFLPASHAMERVGITLSMGKGPVVSRNQAFPYTTADGRTMWVGVLGVPTTIEAGLYHVTTSATTPEGRIQSSATVTVVSRAFHREDIDLDASLSALQTEQTAEKRRQAQELWRILTSFHRDAVYQTGPFIVPVDHYRVSAPFAERRLYVFATGGDEHSIHQGMDLAVPAGTPVHAAGAGKVVFAGHWLMTGNSVVIEHLPGVYSLYYHMERLLVSAGEMVKQGQTVGLVGSTGIATGPHLHWQIEVGGVAVNPMSVVANGLVTVPAALKSPAQ